MNSPDYSLKPASEHTRAFNGSAATPLDPEDFTRAQRGFIASLEDTRITDAQGRQAGDIGRYAFLQGDAPDTVHPNLWRHAKLNVNHGLFEVTEGVWQVRGYDISNITFIKSNTGWIVVDPLTVEATARASYELITKHLGHRPVVAVIYTHSHGDHFGGVLGVTSQAEVDAGKCQVIAPVGFLHEVVGENVIAGPATGRRALYQFGPLLLPGPQGHVDCGLGNALPIGPNTLIAPNRDITFTGEEMLIDGVRVV